MIAGRGMPGDMAAVFADLRFLGGCPASVADLAHFAAHRHDRDQGFTLEKALKVFTDLKNYLDGRSSKFDANVHYSTDNVISSLKRYLKAQIILDQASIDQLDAIKADVSKFALSTMHGCTLYPPAPHSNKKAARARLTTLAIRDGFDDTLEMGALIDIVYNGKPLHVNLAVFVTDLPKSITVGKLSTDLPSSDPNTTVEIDAYGNLVYLS